MILVLYLHRSSRLLSPASSMPVPFESPALTVLDALSLNVTMNNHRRGVTPASFEASAKLTSTFDVLSTNVDRQVACEKCCRAHTPMRHTSAREKRCALRIIIRVHL